MALLSDSDIAEMRDAWNRRCLTHAFCRPAQQAIQVMVMGSRATVMDRRLLVCLHRPCFGESAVNQVQNIDGHVLFSRATSLNNLMRIKITKLHGAALSPTQVYEVVDGPIMHHVGQKVRVRLVRDGSAT